MKLSVIAARDGERVVWPLGLFVVSCVTLLASVGGFLLARMLLPIPLLPGLVLAAMMPPGVVIGRMFRLARIAPIDELPQL